MRPDPGRGGGAGNVSLGSFSLGGFGEAAVDEVAVLPLPTGFFANKVGPDELFRSVSFFLLSI